MEFVIALIILLFSVVIHEVAHGLTADYLGDPTPRYSGRLTLNPVKHLDPFGSVLLPLFLVMMKSPILFGWAKPVPINPYNLRDQRYGSAKVALAGPLSNISLAVIFGLIIRFLDYLTLTPFILNLITIFVFIVQINLILAIFNLLPIPPLDGSHILFALFPRFEANLKILFGQWGIFIFLLVIFFIIPLIFPIVEFLSKLIIGI